MRGGGVYKIYQISLPKPMFYSIAVPASLFSNLTGGCIGALEQPLKAKNLLQLESKIFFKYAAEFLLI
jgi:hypothetical protein